MHSSSEVRVFSAADIRQLLTYPDCIEVLESAMQETSRRTVELPLRTLLQAPNRKGVLGLMPGAMTNPSYLGTKLISMFDGNTALGLSSHIGLICLFNGENGVPVALLEAGSVTAIRTACASALATKHLAREDASSLAIIGTGEEAETHLEALLCVRPITTVTVWGRTPEKVAAFIEKHQGKGGAKLQSAPSVEAAVAGADIITTVTAAKTPILKGQWLTPGQHVNLVGASVASAAEADSDVVTRSRFYVDYIESTLAQAGEFLQARDAGLVTEDHILGEIGAVISGTVAGRQSPTDITVYKSLGIASQDIATAAYILNRGRSEGIGQLVTL
ncbi:ornithine cyclodeaminase family protein [Govanella unica]|uniref:Ornithine cyclodeaminase family protein n=1 Tax=Govanella unica TaxID=2975056 RepID=A0A9X3TYT0_9PROT|nr:ornithine cyclodeaminase family protein [Govania unica]MDA5194234.1 ornithine cyclodeaminase family protein [Govania unica]